MINGPSYFQEFVLTLYGGSKHGPDMLGESMSDLDAIMEVWTDDVQLGIVGVLMARLPGRRATLT